jgi:hypothetical protein
MFLGAWTTISEGILLFLNNREPFRSTTMIYEFKKKISLF